MSPKIVDKKEKKDQIILSAIKVFVEKGFEKTTVNDIAQAVGIGKGTIYEYFKSKEEIIDYSFQYFINAMDINFERILLSKTKAKEKLVQIFRSIIGFVNPDSEPLIKLMMNFWGEAMRSQDAKNIIFNDMKKYYHSYRSIFSDIVVEGMEDGSFKKNIDPNHFASIIVGMLDGIFVQWILDKNEVKINALFSTINSVLLNGISNE